MGLFGKSHQRDPKEQVREWTSKLRKEGYQIDRQIRAIQREEEKCKRSIKEAIKKGNTEVCPILAKELIRSRKAINRMHASKAQMNSVVLSMNHQLAAMRVAGSIQQSTDVMKAMQSLVKVPEVARAMRELSKEMMKAGIIQEMLDDAMEDFDDQEEMEEEAQAEIDKVLWEITAGQLGRAPAALDESLPSTSTAISAGQEDKEMDIIEERLEALRS